MDVLDDKWFKKGCKNDHHWFVKKDGKWTCLTCGEPLKT